MRLSSERGRRKSAEGKKKKLPFSVSRKKFKREAKGMEREGEPNTIGESNSGGGNGRKPRWIMLGRRKSKR